MKSVFSFFLYYFFNIINIFIFSFFIIKFEIFDKSNIKKYREYNFKLKNKNKNNNKTHFLNVFLIFKGEIITINIYS